MQIIQLFDKDKYSLWRCIQTRIFIVYTQQRLMSIGSATFQRKNVVYTRSGPEKRRGVAKAQPSKSRPKIGAKENCTHPNSCNYQLES